MSILILALITSGREVINEKHSTHIKYSPSFLAAQNLGSDQQFQQMLADVRRIDADARRIDADAGRIDADAGRYATRICQRVVNRPNRNLAGFNHSQSCGDIVEAKCQWAFAARRVTVGPGWSVDCSNSHERAMTRRSLEIWHMTSDGA